MEPIAQLIKQIHWADPAVQASAIGAIGGFLSTLVAAICAAVIGKVISGRKKLLEKLETAFQDIDFLLAVEAEHCSIHQNRGDSSNKNRVRSIVREKGLFWSGRNTPSRRSHPHAPST